MLVGSPTGIGVASIGRDVLPPRFMVLRLLFVMTAVTSAQTPPTDLLLSLMLGMVGGSAMEGTSTTIGKSGEFAGFLELLEGESLAAEELPADQFPHRDLQRSADGQLNSLMTASLTSASPHIAHITNQPSGSREEGSDRIELTRPGLRPQAARVGEFGTGASGPARTGELPGVRTNGETNAVNAESQPLKEMASDVRVTVEAPRLQAADSTEPETSSNRSTLGDQQALGATEQSATELTAQSPSAPHTGERSTRSNSHRESNRSTSEGSWEWGDDAISAALPQTATAVTAISAGTEARQDSLHASMSEVAESPEIEASHRRPERSESEAVALSPQEPSELVDLQGEFESHLEQLAESFPLDSVAAQIATAVEPDNGWITVEIQPPELGKLEIMVSKQGDDYLARIVAHEAATSDALNLQREQLIDALGQHGLELKEVQISSETSSGNGWTQTETQQESNQGRERQGYGEDRPQSDSNRQSDAPNSPSRVQLFRAESGEQKQINLLV